ncbi:hypothetical protein AVEN_239300-1 [Araneus ventricosus]|uniref:Uncharacterized protein n=1 Tax=Araneus ventricosus TaxID=182803 RepID=A0A4Y2CPN3_ARAVE|nr:hypothetical protein AVEN_239300-1 [Araneus ventricosus]
MASTRLPFAVRNTEKRNLKHSKCFHLSNNSVLWFFKRDHRCLAFNALVIPPEKMSNGGISGDLGGHGTASPNVHLTSKLPTVLIIDDCIRCIFFNLRLRC